MTCMIENNSVQPSQFKEASAEIAIYFFFNRELRKNHIYESGRTRFKNNLEIIFNFDFFFMTFQAFAGFFRYFCSFS